MSSVKITGKSIYNNINVYICIYINEYLLLKNFLYNTILYMYHSTGVGKLSGTPAHAKLQVLFRTNVVLRGRLQVQSTAPDCQALAGAWRSGMTPVFYRIRMRIESGHVPAGVQVIHEN
jgi:hypothetical protein